MARMNNPMFQPQGSPLDGLNQGVAMLFQTLMNEPTAADRAKSQAEMDYLRARTNAANLDVRQAQGQQMVGGQIADLFIPQEGARPDPGFEGPMPQRPVGDVLREGLPQVYGNAMAYGMKPDDVASTVMGLMPWANAGDPTMASAYVGTGKPLGVNDAFSLEGRDAVSARDAAEAQAQALAVEYAKPVGVNAGQDVYLGAGAEERGTPSVLRGRDTETTARATAFQGLPDRMQDFAVGPTETEFRGTTLAEEFANLGDMGPEQQNYFGLEEDRTPRNYLAPDNQQGITLDGTTDSATGAPIPAGSTVFTGQLQSTDASGLRPNVVGKLQESQLALADFQTTTSRLRKVASSDPSLFGATGNLKRFGQALVQQGSALAGAFDDARFAEVADDLQRAGVAPEFFDPNLNIVDKLATMAAYQAAAVAGQTGQGLSNKDFDKFRGMIGDPTAWLSDQQSFITGLDSMEALVLDMAKNRQRFLDGGVRGAAPQDSGVADALTPPEEAGRPVYDINGNRVR